MMLSATSELIDMNLGNKEYQRKKLRYGNRKIVELHAEP
jgi:hypothetical protein